MFFYTKERNTRKIITFVPPTLTNKVFEIMENKENLEKEIEKLKKDLQDYLEIFPILGVSEKEKERVINQFLDDILIREKKLKKIK